MKRPWVQLLVEVLPLNNSGQVVHTHAPLSLSNIIWYWVPVKGPWHSAALKVTIGLAFYWQCVTQFVVYLGSVPVVKEREMSTLSMLWVWHRLVCFWFDELNLLLIMQLILSFISPYNNSILGIRLSSSLQEKCCFSVCLSLNVSLKVKVKSAMPQLGCRRGAHLPLAAVEPVGG